MSVASGPPSAVGSSAVGSQAAHVLSNEPDSAIHRINYEWSMKDLEEWSKARQEQEKLLAAGLAPTEVPKEAPGPLTFGGRIWWSAAARLSSILVLLLAIVAESLTILRDVTARITNIDTKELGNEDDDSSLDIRRLLNRATESKSNSGADEAQCQWVKDTDVQNNSMGIAMAVLYHMLTTGILAILVMAEFQIWTYKLHASATLNIGIIQLWAGFATVSRAINDTFSQIIGWALVLTGASNMAFGCMDRFTLGGPGLMLFGTGIRIAPSSSQGNGEDRSNKRRPRRQQDPKPPHPVTELVESEKAALISQQRSQAGQGPMPWELPVANRAPVNSARHTTAATSSASLRSGTTNLPSSFPEVPAEMRPFVEQLAMKDPAAYQQLVHQWSAFGQKIQQERPKPSGINPEAVHFSADVPSSASSKRAKGKKWKNRMSHDLF